MMLSSREKFLIGLLLVVLAATGVFFMLKSLNENERLLVRRIEARQGLLLRARAVDSELKRLSKIGKRKSTIRSLIGYVESLTQRIGLKNRVQLNLLTKERTRGLQGVELKVDNLTLDEMVKLVYTIENAGNQLIIDQLDLSPSFRDKDLLRLSMRVLAR